MYKPEQTLRLKIAHIDMTDWYEERMKWAAHLDNPPQITNVDLFMVALANRCKTLDDIQAIVDDIKPHKDLYEGISSPIFPRPVPPRNVDEAIRQFEYDIQEKRAGREHIY